MDSENPNFTLDHQPVDVWRLDPEDNKAGHYYLPKGKRKATSPSADEIHGAIEMARLDGEWLRTHGGKGVYGKVHHRDQLNHDARRGPKKLHFVNWTCKKTSEDDEECNTSELNAVYQGELDVVATLSTSGSHFLEQMLRLKKRDKALVEEIGWARKSEAHQPIYGDSPAMAAAKAAVKAVVDDLLDARYNAADRKAYSEKLEHKRVEFGGWTKVLTQLQEKEETKKTLIKIGLLANPAVTQRQRVEAKAAYKMLKPFLKGVGKFPDQVLPRTTPRTIEDDDDDCTFGGFPAPMITKPAKPTDGAGTSVVVGTAARK